MRRAALVVGIVLVVAGGVWVLQGFDISFAPESFMTGNREWVFFGGTAIVVGVGLLAWSRRRS